MHKFVFLSLFCLSGLCHGQSVNTPTSNELKVLSWNIFMRPMLLFKDGQMDRAQAIIEKLKEEDYDIIVFQEAFFTKARNILWEGLKDVYPHQLGPGSKGLFKTTSGVWIISKHPFLKIEQIQFDQCKVGDCLAKKGALFVEVQKNGQKFQLVGTHLQAEDGKEYQQVRETQYRQIKKELLDKYAADNIPQLVVGDMNTAPQDHEGYTKMLEIFDAQDGFIKGLQEIAASWGGKQNDLLGVDENRQGQLLDYILIKSNGLIINNVKRNIKAIRKLWNGKQQDLSDHYAVEAIINY